MTSYTLYRCPVDGQLYAEVPGLAVHPGLAAVRYYATSPHSPEAKRHRFWARVLRAMERQAAQVQASRGQGEGDSPAGVVALPTESPMPPVGVAAAHPTERNAQP